MSFFLRPPWIGFEQHIDIVLDPWQGVSLDPWLDHEEVMEEIHCGQR